MEYVPAPEVSRIEVHGARETHAAMPVYSTARGERKANVWLQFSSRTAKELPLPESCWQERFAVGARFPSPLLITPVKRESASSRAQSLIGIERGTSPWRTGSQKRPA